MIAYIDGKLTHKDPTSVIIEANGVGYFIKISLNTFGKIQEGERCKLLTVLHIKEDAHTLYGFFDGEEKRLFNLLTSISGIGPSIALMALSSILPSDLEYAIANEDIKQIQMIKGVGIKTAQRIVLELKDKIKKDSTGAVPGATLSNSLYNTTRNEALTALQTLGIDKKIAEKSVDTLLKLNPSITLEDLIRRALKTS